MIDTSSEIDESELLENIKLLGEAAENIDLEKELNLIEKLVPTYKRTPNNNTID